MKVLITGGAGMVGSHCAEYYARKRHTVIVVDNLMRSQIFGSDKKSVEYNWRYLAQFPKVKRLQKDIRDREDMRRIFKRERPDLVIHAAGQPGVRHSLENPLEDYAINATGTLNLLEALRETNPKGMFIYCSTNKVYGDNVNKVPIVGMKKRYMFKGINGIKEQFSIDMTGHTPYGVSKLVGDLYTQDYANIFGIKSAIFRMSCIYGTRQFGFEDQGWLAWFASRFFRGEPITLYGDGRQVRDILWVGDLINAFEAFTKTDLRFKGEVFNIGGGKANTLSLLELVDILQDISGKRVDIRFGDWRKFDQKVYVSDTAKARKLLKWKPQVAPKEGVRRIYQWIQENPKLFIK